MAVNCVPAGDRLVNNYQSVSFASWLSCTKFTAALTVYCGWAPVVFLQLKDGTTKRFKLIGSVNVAPGSVIMKELIVGVVRVSEKV